MFSLKNPAYPEYICESSTGVMSIDFHPQHPHMLLAGLYDGNVAVYNLQKNNCSKLSPVFKSDAKNGKHSDTVWQVKWVPDDLDRYLNFYSGIYINKAMCPPLLWSFNYIKSQFFDLNFITMPVIIH